MMNGYPSYPPFYYPPPGPDRNPIEEMKQTLAFMEEWEKRQKEKNVPKKEEPKKWYSGFINIYIVLLILFPFVGSAYTIALLTALKSYSTSLQQLLK